MEQTISYNRGIHRLEQSRWSEALALTAHMASASVRADVVTLNSAARRLRCRWRQAVHQVEVLSPGIRMNVISYNSLVSNCLEWQLPLHLLHTMRRTTCPGNLLSFNSAMRHCEWQRALGLVRDAPEAPDVVSCSTVASRLGDRWQRGIMLLEAAHSSHVQLNIFAYNALSSQWQQVSDLLKRLPARELRPDVVTYSLLATSAWAWSWEVLQKMRRQQVAPDGAVFRVLSFAWQSATAVLVEMRRATLEASGSPTLGAWHTAIGDWQSALQLWDRLPLGGAVGPRVCWPLAVALLGQLRQLRQEPSADGLVPWRTALEAPSLAHGALGSLARAGRWRRAISAVATEAKDVASVSLAVSACERASRWPPALLLLSQPCTASAYSAAAVALGGARGALGAEWQRAAALLSAMGARNLRATVVTYGAVLASSEKGRRWQQSLQLLAVMLGLRIEATNVALNAAISSCEKARQWQRALALLAEMDSRLLRKARQKAKRKTPTARVVPWSFNSKWSASPYLVPCSL
ncbi:unnamed protein product [Effrenium voratum]|nr:unnamed protein product [Effrenium voratum]